VTGAEEETCSGICKEAFKVLLKRKMNKNKSWVMANNNKASFSGNTASKWFL